MAEPSAGSSERFGRTDSGAGPPGSAGPPKVKICGVTRDADAAAAARLGADFVGAILSPGFSRSVEADHAAGYPLERDGGAGADAVATLVAVLVDPTADEAATVAEVAGAGVIQLHGEEPPDLLGDLRQRGPWELWKAVRVTEEGDVRRAVDRYAGVADGLLVDGGRPGVRGGGHGVRFPWTVLESARTAFPAGLAFIAAGGLRPDNVGEAVRRLSPEVVDVSSGVEAAVGRKDEARIADFIARVRNAAPGSGS